MTDDPFPEFHREALKFSSWSRRSVGFPMKVCGARTLGFMICGTFWLSVRVSNYRVDFATIRCRFITSKWDKIYIYICIYMYIYICIYIYIYEPDPQKGSKQRVGPLRMWTWRILHSFAHGDGTSCDSKVGPFVLGLWFKSENQWHRKSGPLLHVTYDASPSNRDISPIYAWFSYS